MVATLDVSSFHGLRRTNEDKRRAVLTLLRDAEWASKSDRWISERCGVSDRFVNGLRASTANDSQSAPRQGKDGKTRKAPSKPQRGQLSEALHPETKHGGDHGNQHTGGKTTSCRSATFAEDTAAKTGQSRRTVERAAAIGEKLVPELKDAIREDPDIADNQSALSALAAPALVDAVRKGEVAVSAAAIRPPLNASPRTTSARVARGGAAREFGAVGINPVLSRDALHAILTNDEA